MLSVHSDFLMHPILILTHIHIVTATNGALHEEEQSSVTKKIVRRFMKSIIQQDDKKNKLPLVK